MFKKLLKQTQWRNLAKRQKYKKLGLQILRRTISNIQVQQSIFIEQEKFMKLNNQLGKIKNICFLTGRHRSVYKILGVSRLIMKELINTGFCIGLKKSSW